MNVSQGKTKKKNLPFTFNENRTWQIQIDSICTIWNLLTKGALVTGRGRQFLGWGFWGLVIIIILFLLPLAIRNFQLDCKLEWKNFGKESSRVIKIIT